jgi:hypothetical protein
MYGMSTTLHDAPAVRHSMAAATSGRSAAFPDGVRFEQG